MELYMAITAGLGGMFGWGLADFFAKKTVGKIDATRTLLWMQFFGIIPLCIYLIFNWELARITPPIIFFLLLLGIGNVSAYLLFYRGLEKGLVSILSPVFASQAAVAVLVSAFFFKETIEPVRWIGLTCSFLGIVMVSFQFQGLKELSGKKLTKGLPEVLAGMLIFGFFFPVWDWFLKYQGQGWVLSTITLRIIAMVFLTILIYIVARRKKIQPKIKPEEKNVWTWLILIGLFDALASLFAAWGYRFTTMTSVVIIFSAAFPLPTIILARIFLKEKLALNQVIGVAAIVGGLIILAL